LELAASVSHCAQGIRATPNEGVGATSRRRRRRPSRSLRTAGSLVRPGSMPRIRGAAGSWFDCFVTACAGRGSLGGAPAVLRLLLLCGRRSRIG
jgi:hypothetical protein